MPPPAPDDPDALKKAKSILERHDLDQAEDNVRAAVRDFLVAVELAKPAGIELEGAAGDGGRCDLRTDDVIFEFKRRIGSRRGLQPEQDYVDQLDRYLASARDSGRPQRVGVLTDGRNWIARWPGMKSLRTDAQYAHELKSPEGWLELYRWLSQVSQALEERDIPASDEEVRRRLGPGPRFDQHIGELRALYEANREHETIRVKRELWRRLLSAALGVAVEEEPDLDSLFLKHTYLSVVVGLAVQGAFGIDIVAKAESEPGDLIEGRIFQDETGVRGVVESDFFGWPAEVGGERWLRGMARRVAHFDWRNAETDIARILYESVIPAEDRKRLGEYYTPLWLARAIVDELVGKPLEQRVLDPACGSGTFIYAAVERFLHAAREAGWSPTRTLDQLPQMIQGIDVHPVSVHLARATWTFAARDALEQARDAGLPVQTVAPIYLGDSLQLRTAGQDMFSRDRVRIEVGDDENRALEYPLSLAQQSDRFDEVISDITEAIELGDDPRRPLDELGLTEGHDRVMMETTIETLQALHAEGRNHIWGYYSRNLIRPALMSRVKVDVIVGNPPWLPYSKSRAIIREELEAQSRNEYGIWTGGKYAGNQDVSGLFFARCAHLYGEPGTRIGMVLPHSALQSGQYRAWRTGDWGTVDADLSLQLPWDLEQINPNTFFPVPSCVVFARHAGDHQTAQQLPKRATLWLGKEGQAIPAREVSLTDTSTRSMSPYGERARQGASIRPRCLMLVEVEEATVSIAADLVKTTPRRGSLDKEPWRSLDLRKLHDLPIEREYIWPIHLGETVAPYVLLPPLQAVLPMPRGVGRITKDDQARHGITAPSLARRISRRWREVNLLWEKHRGETNELSLLERIDYVSALTAQSRRLSQDYRSGLYTTESLSGLHDFRHSHGSTVERSASDRRREALRDSLRDTGGGILSPRDSELDDDQGRSSTTNVEGAVRGAGYAQTRMAAADSGIRQRQFRASGNVSSSAASEGENVPPVAGGGSESTNGWKEHIESDRPKNDQDLAGDGRGRTRDRDIDDVNSSITQSEITVLYSAAGRPTAAAIGGSPSVFDETLYWIDCLSLKEADYLLAIINSTMLWDALIPMAPKNWAGNSRHVHKHLWRLPIPEFDPDDALHLEIAEAGADAAVGAEAIWREIEAERVAVGKSVSVTVARREIRAWLAESAEGRRVEELVGRLLSA